MNLRFETDDIKLLIDRFISQSDYKSARHLFYKNKEVLIRESPEWSKKVRQAISNSSRSSYSDSRSSLKVVIDYNNEINEAEKNNDIQRLYRIGNDIERKFLRQKITREDYDKLKKRVAIPINKDKYGEIFSLIRSSPSPSEWMNFIEKERNLSVGDIKILNRILRVSTTRINNAFEKGDIDEGAEYIVAIRKFIVADNTNFNSKLNNVVMSNVNKLLSRMRSPFAIDNKIHELFEKQLFSEKDRDLLLEKNREYRIDLIKTALSSLEFAKADSFGKVDGYNYEPDKKSAIEKLKLKIYQNDIQNDILASAISYGVITPEEVAKQRKRAEEDEKARKEEIRKQHLKRANDQQIMRDNGLLEIAQSDGIIFGFCLDLYTIESTKVSDGEFNNKRSELGQMIHDLKYGHITDEVKRNIIKNKLISEIVSKTSGLSLWSKNIVIVPMPFSKDRTLQPVYEIAKMLANEKGKLFSSDILHKNNKTEAKSTAEEFDDGVFTEDYHGEPISVLIVDDTYGKGRSLRASVKALKCNPKIKDIYYMGVVKNRKGGLISDGEKYIYRRLENQSALL